MELRHLVEAILGAAPHGEPAPVPNTRSQSVVPLIVGERLDLSVQAPQCRTIAGVVSLLDVCHDLYDFAVARTRGQNNTGHQYAQ